MNHEGRQDTEMFREKIDDFIYDVRNDPRTLRRDFRYNQRVVRNKLFGKTYRTTLKEILETGKLGRLQVGMTADHAACAMGEPDWGREKLRHSEFEFWSYGNTEVFFYKDPQTLFYYKIPLRYAAKFPINVVLNGYFPRVGTTLAEFENYLQKNDIEYVVLWQNFEQTRWAIVHIRPGNLYIQFDEDTLEIGGLYCHDDLTTFRSHLASHITLTIYDLLNDYALKSERGIVFEHAHYAGGNVHGMRLSVSYKADKLNVTQVGKLGIMGVPDLGIEVCKPQTDLQEVLGIVRRCFDAGTKEFWIVFPMLRMIYQYKSSEPDRFRIYRGSETIDAEALFPGIEGLTTDAIFHLPEWIIIDEEESES